MSKYKNYAVLGLGRFGLSVVKTLSEKNVNILACDKVENRTQEATRSPRTQYKLTSPTRKC